MKKYLIILMAFILAFSLLGCKNDKTTTIGSITTVKREPEKITIPTVEVDLFDPENKVQVDEFEPSTVKESSGRVLTDDEWLLNSKFSKDYILKLGVGEYDFKYESEIAYGDIKLIIKDSMSPNYCFNKNLNEIAYYDELKILPLLVKNQDSFQDDFEPTYNLYKKVEGTLVSAEYHEFNDEGFRSLELEGEMLWRASVIKDEKTYDFDWEFHVETKEEYKSRVYPTAFITKETQRFVTYTDGEFILDSTSIGSSSSDYLFFKIDPEIIDNAKRAEFSLLRVTVYRLDGEDTFGINQDNGQYDIGLWIYDKWNEVFCPCAFTVDNYRRENIIATREATEEYVKYTMDFHINGIKPNGEECFDGTGLTFQFAYQLACMLSVNIEFGVWDYE